MRTRARSPRSRSSSARTAASAGSRTTAVGLGGVQTDAFLLSPTSFREPALPLVGAPAIHDVLTGWLDDLGLRSDPAPGAEVPDLVIRRSEPAETTAAAIRSA